MPVEALTDTTLFLAGVDLTSNVNRCSLMEEATELDKTTFGSGGRKEVVGGITHARCEYAGFWDAAEPETILRAAFGSNLGVLSVSDSGADGDRAWTMLSLEHSYSFLGRLGELIPIDVRAAGNGGLVVGNLLFPKGNVTGATNGTGLQMGALPAGKKVFAAVHCFSAGTTADVIVEHDDNASFTSATTAISRTVTAAGGTWDSDDTVTTDNYWRVRFASVTGTFSFAVVVGIR